MTPPDPDDPSVIAAAVASHLRALDPGPLAALRRMGAGGAPALWRLMAQHPAMGNRPAEWQAITRILAILTPKGAAEGRPRLGEGARVPLGRALCDGGDPGWRPDPAHPRGVIREDRLARFLATRGPMRAVALERLARAVARTLPPDRQVSPADIAWAILRPDDPHHRIARAYYARLDLSRDKDSPDE